MNLVVTDASIFIDLIYIGAHDYLFGLNIEVHTTAEIVDELNDEQQQLLSKYIDNGKLNIHNGTAVSRRVSIEARKGLSESDKSVLYLALHLNSLVLTGDGLLRRISQAENIEVHGLLWLLDEFLAANIISKVSASERLRKLMTYNKRLPVEECEERLQLWI